MIVTLNELNKVINLKYVLFISAVSCVEELDIFNLIGLHDFLWGNKHTSRQFYAKC